MGLTGNGGCSGGSPREVTATGDFAFLLEVAVHGIVAMILESVRVVTSPSLEDWTAISTGSTSVVQGLLQS